MKKAILFLILSVAIGSAVLASGPASKAARRLFPAKYAPATESITLQLYKPARSKNFSTGFGPGSDWTLSGGSRMTYTASGKILVQLDTSGFLGSTFYRKEIHTYDASGRETEILYQMYDPQTMNWTNSSRSVVIFDQQGQVQESRFDQWINGSWAVYGGYQDVRSYNAQNRLTSRLRKTYNNTTAAWENDGRTIDYQYDAQNRLISFTDQDWDTTAFVNVEKVLLEYGTDNRPNLAIMQNWNGTTFVDSSRIIEIQWFFWQGSVETALPLSFIEQKKSGLAWVNYEKGINSYDGNGSNIQLTQVFVNGQWRNDTRSSSIFDDKLNPVFFGQEEYDAGTAKWDTLLFSNLYLNTYDAAGRILETQQKQMSNSPMPDDPNIGWRNVSKRLFYEHQGFTSTLPEKEMGFSLSPNPLAAGSSFRMAAGSGRLSILDMQGRLVNSQNVGESEVLSTAGIKPGVYQILFQDEQGNASRSRLVLE